MCSGGPAPPKQNKGLKHSLRGVNYLGFLVCSNRSDDSLGLGSVGGGGGCGVSDIGSDGNHAQNTGIDSLFATLHNILQKDVGH